MTKYILAHDFGTSANKATLYTTDGDLLESNTYSYETNFFSGNCAEQNPEDWWKAICGSTRAIMKKINPRDVLAVSFSGQTHGCLAIDREGRALRNSIIYCDNRSASQMNEIGKKIDEFEFYKITGSRFSAVLPVAKLMWIRDHEPDTYKRTYKAVNAKDYIVSRFTGRIVTDVNEASYTGACDLKTGKWSEKIINISGIDPDKLPEIKPSTFIAGEISAKTAEETGLAAGTPVVIGSSDGSCATIGSGAVYENSSYLCLGSSAWICLTSSKLDFDPKMDNSMGVGAIPGKYHHYGTMQSACTVYNWLRSQLCAKEEMEAERLKSSVYSLMDQLAESSLPGARGVLFHPYPMGERSPRWNSAATAAFLGIDINTRREDMIRAVLEGVAYNLKCIYESLNKLVPMGEISIIGGGAKSDVWCQILSDVLNCRITRPTRLDQATSMGAAVIGGVGAGVFGGFEAVEKFIKISKVYRPNPEARERYDEMYSLFNSSYEALLGFYQQRSLLKQS
ncbi:MAG TPA: FGGY-family carbohydrate kinase [Clostridia bacterium]|nr:FGGY-family carbohydrate kinase [Clostridia bacterium]